MRRVGLRYEQGEYFLSALIMAAEIFREIMEIVQPVVVETQKSSTGSGIVLLGNGPGDIHDIGKNIISILASCHGFIVHDLGVDVPPEVFVAQAEALKPDLVGLSGLITASLRCHGPDHRAPAPGRSTESGVPCLSSSAAARSTNRSARTWAPTTGCAPPWTAFSSSSDFYPPPDECNCSGRSP